MFSSPSSSIFSPKTNTRKSNFNSSGIMIGIKRVCINPFINTVVSRTCHTRWFTLWVLHMSYNLWAIEWEWRFIQYTYIISCMFIYMERKYITEQLLTIFESTWIWWTSVMLPLRWFGSTNHDQTHVSIPSPPTKLLNLEDMWRAEWWIGKGKVQKNEVPMQLPIIN